MENQALAIKSRYRQYAMWIAVGLLANLLGMINIGTIYGFKIHFFQVAIFISAAMFGSAGGLTVGVMGSLYSAIIMNNPYIVGGNAILGWVAGYLMHKKMPVLPAVYLAFWAQLPWLILTDIYLINMPLKVLEKLIIALLLSNTIWGVVTALVQKKLKSQ